MNKYVRNIHYKEAHYKIKNAQKFCLNFDAFYLDFPPNPCYNINDYNVIIGTKSVFVFCLACACMRIFSGFQP